LTLRGAIPPAYSPEQRSSPKSDAAFKSYNIRKWQASKPP